MLRDFVLYKSKDACMLPKNEYYRELMADCGRKTERECCLVQKDTKEQKLLIFNSNFGAE